MKVNTWLLAALVPPGALTVRVPVWAPVGTTMPLMPVLPATA